jgi:uncharacterized membrane protein YsdA (DUF1294 family)
LGDNYGFILIISGALIIWNVVTFSLYGIDKWKSTHNKRRVRESTLLLLAFLLGGVGAVLGMSAFHHKTRHWKFKILVPLAVVFNVALLIGAYYLTHKTW